MNSCITRPSSFNNCYFIFIMKIIYPVKCKAPCSSKWQSSALDSHSSVALMFLPSSEDVYTHCVPMSGSLLLSEMQLAINKLQLNCKNLQVFWIPFSVNCKCFLFSWNLYAIHYTLALSSWPQQNLKQ